MLWAAGLRQAYLLGRNRGPDLVRGFALPAFGVYRCNFVKIIVASLDSSVCVVRCADGRRIQLREWTFAFLCPVHVVTGYNRSAGLPIQVYRVSFRLGTRILRRGRLGNSLAKA